ncbi:unnamed protein product, partial [Candidula unifasciata]
KSACKTVDYIMDKSLQQFHPEVKDKAHFALHNNSTAPTLISVSVLDAVLEEDENTHKDLLDTHEVDKRIDDGRTSEVILSSEAVCLASRLKQNSGIQIPENLCKGSIPEHFSKDQDEPIIQKSEIFQESIVYSEETNFHCDLEDQRHQDCHSYNDMIDSEDKGNDKEWDTDLETDDSPMIYDDTGKTAYLEGCRKFKVVPVTYFLRHINDSHLSMKHHDLTGDEMKAVAASLA